MPAVPGWEVAGKTGTTDGHADAWFLGMTPVLTAVVWHGNPLGKIGDAGFGGNIPATIFRRFMTAQLDGVPSQGWEGPPAWCNAPGQFLSQAGRASVPEGYEIVDGKLVPTTLPPPRVIVNPTPTTRPTAITTRPTVPPTQPPVTTTVHAVAGRSGPIGRGRGWAGGRIVEPWTTSRRCSRFKNTTSLWIGYVTVEPPCPSARWSPRPKLRS